MKVFAGRSGCLGKGALKRKAKRRRGLPVARGLAACALGIAVAAMLGAAPTDAVPDDPAALPAVSADDGQVTVTVPTEVPCVMLGDGSIIGPATWSIENGSGKAARLANVHAERKAQSVEASATTKGGTALLEVSPASATFNQGFTLDAGASADFSWSAAVTDDIERSEALSGALLGPTSLLTLTFTFAAVEDEPQPSAASAFAVFSADDGSLTLYNRAEAPVEGTSFLGKEATRVYTGIENSRSTQPWRDVAERIASVSVADAGVAPKSLYAWFFGCSSLSSVDLDGLDTSGTTTMAFMFSRASALESLDLSMLDTSSCTDFSDVFQDCTSLKSIDMTGWDTSKGTTFAQMLFNCKSLGHVDLSPLDTSSAVSFRQMLYGCKSLEELDLTGISTASATNGYGMFSGMTSLATVRLGAAFSWVGGAYLPLPSAAGVPSTDGKWHSVTSGKAYLPADVPCGVEDSYSALPPATAAAEEELDASENGTAHDNLAPR